METFQKELILSLLILKKKQTKLSKTLCQNVNGTGSIMDIYKISDFTGYNIIVFSIELGFEIIAQTELKNSLGNIYLLKYENHFDLVTSPSGLLLKDYFCEKCLVGYNKKHFHKCTGYCKLCKSKCGEKIDNGITCKKCNCWFKNEICLEGHKCDKVWCCLKCKTKFHLPLQKSYEKKFEDMYDKKIEYDFKEYHQCTKSWCKFCCKYVNLKTHTCFIQPVKPKITLAKYIYIDLQSFQDHENFHKINLAVAQYKDGKTFIFENNGDDVITKFCNWLFDDKHRGFTIIAHNMGGGQPILKHLLERGEKPNVIYKGHKILSLTLKRGVNSLESIRLIDSYNFLPMTLREFPKTFNIEECQINFFPISLNIPENWDYSDIIIPPFDTYLPDDMKLDVFLEFKTWYKNNKHQLFNFKEHIINYSKNNVEILRKGCETFRKIFRQLTTKNDIGVEPFQYPTISSACFSAFRWISLKKNKIMNTKKEDIRHSKLGSICMDYYSHKLGIDIQHGLNGGEKILVCQNQKNGRVHHFSVDGFHKNVIYEFHGDYFHGNPELYKRTEWNPMAKKTMGDLYDLTQYRKNVLKENGYEVVEIWEKDFKKEMKTQQFIDWFKDGERTYYGGLDLRKGLLGGRTEVFQCYKKDSSIKYFDIVSLYPYIMCNKFFPVGNPVILNYKHKKKGKTLKDLIINDEVFGLAMIKILPPKNLLHPVLPVKINDKLIFTLCMKCAKNKHKNCNHNEKQRVLCGVFTTFEIQEALRQNYKLIDVYEIHHFPKKSKKLFSSYMKSFFDIKQKAKKNNNDGLYNVAKLMINNLWGRISMKEKTVGSKIIKNRKDFYKFIKKRGKTINISNINDFNEEVIEILYEYIDSPIRQKSILSNEYIGIFTTSYGRLELLKHMNKIGENVLYVDTDGLFFYGRDDIQTSLNMGGLKDEMNGKIITEFLSLAPKTYAYKYIENGITKTSLKAKGFTISKSNSEKLDLEGMLKLLNGDTNKIELTENITLQNKNHKNFKNIKRIKCFNFNFDKRILKNDFSSIPFGYISQK